MKGRHHGASTPEVLRRGRGGAALPPRRRAPVRRAARRQRADPQAGGRARRPALRPDAPQRARSRSPGKALLVEARRVLHQAEVAQLAARNARALAGARLRIGYVPDALPASVPRALQHLASAAPRVEVALETGTPLRLIAGRPRPSGSTPRSSPCPRPTKGLRVTSLGHQSLVAALPAAERAVHRGRAHARAARPRTPRAAAARRQPRAARRGRLALPPGRTVAGTSSRRPSRASRPSCSRSPPAAAWRCSRRRSTERYAAPGVRLVALAGAEPAFESAVLTQPDTDSLAVHGFLRAVTRAAKPRPSAPAHLRVAA